MSVEPTKCKCCLGTGVTQNWAAIGRECRARRLDAGLSLIDLSHELGVSVSFLSLLELGKRHWNHELLDRFNALIAQKKP